MMESVDQPAAGRKISEATREARPLHRVGSVLNTASSILTAASLTVVGYHSAEATLDIFPVTKHSVRFADEHVVQERVEPAPQGATLHEQPERMLFLHWGAEIGRTVLDYVIFVHGLPAALLVWRILAAAAVVAAICKWPGLWRHGPGYAYKTSQNVFTFIYVAFILPLIFAAFVRGDQNIPFQNRLKSTLLIAASSYFSNLTGLCGQIKDEHPWEPLSSLTRPLVLAGLRSGRIMDALTDISMIRILLDKRTSGQCMERNACSMYLILAILVGVFAALDFVIGFGLVFLSTKLSTRSVNSIRILRNLHTVSLFCELGIMAVTIAQLTKEASASGQVARAVSIAVVSLLTTIVSFVVTLVAVQKLFKAKIAEERGEGVADVTQEDGSRFAPESTWL